MGLENTAQALLEVKKNKRKAKKKKVLTSICLKAASKSLPWDENTLRIECIYEML